VMIKVPSRSTVKDWPPVEYIKTVKDSTRLCTDVRAGRCDDLKDRLNEYSILFLVLYYGLRRNALAV